MSRALSLIHIYIGRGKGSIHLIPRHNDDCRRRLFEEEVVVNRHAPSHGARQFRQWKNPPKQAHRQTLHLFHLVPQHKERDVLGVSAGRRQASGFDDPRDEIRLDLPGRKLPDAPSGFEGVKQRPGIQRGGPPDLLRRRVKARDGDGGLGTDRHAVPAQDAVLRQNPGRSVFHQKIARRAVHPAQAASNTFFRVDPDNVFFLQRSCSPLSQHKVSSMI